MADDVVELSGDPAASFTGGALTGAVPAGMTFSKAPAPSAEVSRYLLGASYGVLVMFSALAAALFTASLSISSL